MPEPWINSPATDDIPKLKAVLKYFSASETYNKLDIRPGTNVSSPSLYPVCCHCCTVFVNIRNVADRNLALIFQLVNVKLKGSSAEGIYSLLKDILTKSPYEAFLGKTPEQRALVRQWVNYNLQYVAKNRLQSNLVLKV